MTSEAEPRNMGERPQPGDAEWVTDPDLSTRLLDELTGGALVALSILGVGFSLGGFLVVPLMQTVVDTLGWRGAFLFSGGMTAGNLSTLAAIVEWPRPAGPTRHRGHGNRPLGSPGSPQPESEPPAAQHVVDRSLRDDGCSPRGPHEAAAGVA